MTAQFSAKRVADLGNNFDLCRVVVFRVLQLVDGVFVIDRVSREMDEVGRIAAK